MYWKSNEKVIKDDCRQQHCRQTGTNFERTQLDNQWNISDKFRKNLIRGDAITNCYSVEQRAIHDLLTDMCYFRTVTSRY